MTAPETDWQARAAELQGELEEARKIVADCNNSLFGSQGYFVSEQAADIENLKSYGHEQRARAESAELRATTAEEALKREGHAYEASLAREDEWAGVYDNSNAALLARAQAAEASATKAEADAEKWRTQADASIRLSCAYEDALEAVLDGTRSLTGQDGSIHGILMADTGPGSYGAIEVLLDDPVPVTLAYRDRLKAAETQLQSQARVIEGMRGALGGIADHAPPMQQGALACSMAEVARQALALLSIGSEGEEGREPNC